MSILRAWGYGGLWVKGIPVNFSMVNAFQVHEQHFHKMSESKTKHFIHIGNFYIRNFCHVQKKAKAVVKIYCRKII